MRKPGIALQALVAIALFAGGVAGGIWFSQNYRIVPADQAGAPRESRPAATPAEEGWQLAETQAQLLSAPQAGHSAAALQPNRPKGPFAYKFTPNEKLHYRLDANIAGEGYELLTPSGVGTQFSSDLQLVTESIDSAGNGKLRLDFNRADMNGEFMGGPFELHYGPERTYMYMSGRRLVDTAEGESAKGIPQLEFFQQPIRMDVAPDGTVLRVAGGAGMSQMLSPAALIAPAPFPDPEMPIGSSWDSDFTLPVPGLGTAAPAKAHNTLTGYQNVAGRRCAVVRQDLTSAQQDGTLDSPSSILGDAMQFTMPVFELTGTNMIYFDTDSGHLVHTDMDLHFELVIGEELKPLTNLLSFYGELLDEVEGQPRSQKKETEQEGPLVDLSLDINAAMRLVGEE